MKKKCTWPSDHILYKSVQLGHMVLVFFGGYRSIVLRVLMEFDLFSSFSTITYESL